MKKVKTALKVIGILIVLFALGVFGEYIDNIGKPKEPNLVMEEFHVEPLEAWGGALPQEVFKVPQKEAVREESTEEEFIEYEEPIEEEEYDEPETYDTYEEPVYEEHISYGDCLTAYGGVYWFGEQKETYYNLDMSYVVYLAQQNGLEGEYWVREDGCKMFGNYIILACNRDVHPYGSLVETSLGTGISLDTGGFAVNNPYQVDVAVTW